jgi:hypothetical protein
MNRKATFMLASLIVAFMGACSVAPPAKEVSVLLGKRAADVLECAGPPQKEAQMDGTRYWTYRYEDVTRAATWNCEVRLVIRDGIVSKVDTHTTVENIFGASRSLCADAVKKCSP